jgi:hypothetical protein
MKREAARRHARLSTKVRLAALSRDRATFARRFPSRPRSRVLAGAPIVTVAGDGPADRRAQCQCAMTSCCVDRSLDRSLRPLAPPTVSTPCAR